jgi:hypothetical protein
MRMRRLVVAGTLAAAGLLAVCTTASSGGPRSPADPTAPEAAHTPRVSSPSTDPPAAPPSAGAVTAWSAGRGSGTPPTAEAPITAAPTTPAPDAAADSSPPASTLSRASPTERDVAELPGGGRVMFPGRTLVALYGHPGAPSLGALGRQDLAASITQAKQLAAAYEGRVAGPVIPTFEIIATVATREPGTDGTYSTQWPASKLRPWVDAATEHGMYVIIDLQPGRSTLLSQANAYVDLLRSPNVGLAIDPEWKLAPGERPLHGIGSVDAAEVNGVISWLSRLTAANHLPQKVLVLHQFTPSMLRDEDRIVTDDDHVTVLVHMDGQGSQAGKEAAWASVVRAAPPGVHFGWKNFFEWDIPMLDPAKTLAHEPVPLMISYQ